MPSVPPVDVIISHGPPYDCGDLCLGGDKPGSKKLREEIERIRPQLVVCGHIHENHGRHGIKGTAVINASYVNRQYVPGNEILTFDVDE